MKSLIGLIFVFLTSSAFADIVNSLPKGDALGGVAKAIGQKLSDGNISTGTTNLWAGQLKQDVESITHAQFRTIVIKGFQDAYKDHFDKSVSKTAKIVVHVHNFVDGDTKSGDVNEMTSALMESNDYAESKENREQQNRYLWVVMRKLPASYETLIGHVTTKIKDEDTKETKTVQYFLVANRDGKAVQFFTVEGKM